jgi:hypothetical protein
MQESNTTPKQQGERQPKSIGYRWIWLVLAILAFGLLMGAREDFHSFWIRALLAGCAFAILAGTISWLRKVSR